MTNKDESDRLSLEKMLEKNCKCVGKHVPLPHKFHYWKIGEQEVYLCPTTSFNLTEYLRVEAYKRPSERKHYSEYVQNLARQILEGV